MGTRQVDIPAAARTLAGILNDCEIITVASGGGSDLMIECGQMYDPPPEITPEQGKALQELFGCSDVRLNHSAFAQSGCESCDWGSRYGHEISIVGATKNLNLRAYYTAHTNITWSLAD